MSSHHPEDPYRYGTGPQDDVPPDAYAPPYPGAAQPYPQPPYPQQPYLPPGSQSPQYAPPGYPASGPWQHGQPQHGQPNPRYPRPGHRYAAYPPYAVAPKSPAIGALASFFLPGLGSMINGDVGKGVFLLFGFIVSAVLTIIVIGFVGMLIFWIWAMVDGYQGAQRWNLRHGILS